MSNTNGFESQTPDDSVVWEPGIPEEVSRMFQDKTNPVKKIIGSIGGDESNNLKYLDTFQVPTRPVNTSSIELSSKLEVNTRYMISNNCNEQRFSRDFSFASSNTMYDVHNVNQYGYIGSDASLDLPRSENYHSLIPVSKQAAITDPNVVSKLAEQYEDVNHPMASIERNILSGNVYTTESFTISTSRTVNLHKQMVIVNEDEKPKKGIKRKYDDPIYRLLRANNNDSVRKSLKNAEERQEEVKERIKTIEEQNKIELQELEKFTRLSSMLNDLRIQALPSFKKHCKLYREAVLELNGKRDN